MADAPAAASALIFEASAVSTGPRLGRLAPNLETPCLLLPTSCGSLPFLSADLAATLPHFAALLDLSELLDFVKLDHPSKYSALPPGTLTVLSAASMVKPQLNAATSTGMLLETANGRKEVTPSFLLSAAAAFKATMVIAMSDEPAFGSSRKRMAKAADRTTLWLQQSTLEASEACLLGVVTGGIDSEARKRAAETVARHGLRGAVIGGLGSGETPEDRAAAVKSALAAFPTWTLRVAPIGYSSPSELLAAVEMGIDVIGTAYANFLTENGLALALPLLAGGAFLAAVVQVVSTKQVLNLRDNDMRRDTRPLVAGCGCHCCAHHHRAYVHHLLIAREMSGQVLLQLHNTHHLLDFAAAIRQSLRDGTFQALKQAINGPYT